MPYAQSHYPFENKKSFEGAFPADFIAEGIDQTRGWFYTLLVVSTALFNKPPYKNLIVNGLVLARYPLCSPLPHCSLVPISPLPHCSCVHNLPPTYTVMDRR